MNYWRCPSCTGLIPVRGGPDPHFLCAPCRRKAFNAERAEAVRDAERRHR